MPAIDYKQAIQHLGGAGPLKVMVNARDYVVGPDYVAFKFSGNRSMNKAVVQLNGSDLYNLSLYMLRGADKKLVAEECDIYAEDLKGVFERLSGLVLSIPRIRGFNA